MTSQPCGRGRSYWSLYLIPLTDHEMSLGVAIRPSATQGVYGRLGHHERLAQPRGFSKAKNQSQFDPAGRLLALACVDGLMGTHKPVPNGTVPSG